MHRIILASQSPRRKELLSLIVDGFEVITADVDERSIEEEVLKKHDKIVIDSYNLLETDTELYLTEQVNNILFKKN